MNHNNMIVEKSITQYYCTNCDMFLADRFVHGNCKNCGFFARGDQCDSCSLVFDSPI